MLKSILIGVVVGALGLAVEAQASSRSYTSTITSQKTDWSNNVGLQQFNPSLGTLNSIQINLSSGMTTSITVVNSSTNSSSGTAKTELQISLDTSSIGNYNLFGSSNPVLDYYSPTFSYSLAGGGSTSSGNLTQTGSRISSGTLTDSTLLNDFTGSGLVTLVATTRTSTDLSNTGGNTTESESTTAGLVSTVTYNYTAAPVPEPSAFAVFAAGMVGLGLVWRFRGKAKAK